MRALVKRDGVVQHVTDAPFPPLKRPDDVRIRVVIAALCRTDLYAARGLLPTPDPVVLGHEFSGIIDAIGPAVTGLSPGDRVAVHPALPCGQCHPCHSGQRCPHVRFLGVHRDGAFAEAIVVPRAAVHRLPEPLSFVQGAYAEPVAASLAVLGKGPHPDERWIIYGTGRIAHLTQ
ncbi:MAG: alcohol dehydrogenase catalytic domain-containing protein, partial [Myxococcota bacterium]